MLNFNDKALRAQVKSDYAFLARGVEGEARLNEIIELVMDATVRVLRDSMHASNQHSLVARLPPEVLGGCFALLSLHDGIRASHVSRSWRAVALSTPQVWSNLEMDCKNASDFEFAVMALSRSGSLANLRLSSTYPTPATAFDALILPHLHQVMSLSWFSEFNIDTLRQAAPFLEHLRFTRGMLDIPHDFLGGHAARLRSLHCISAHLPNTCPALSTLVELRIDKLESVHHAASFARLFELCPRLESLTLCGLTAAHSHLLPSGPPPTCLRKIFLKTGDPECDLMRHLLAWHTPNLRAASLDMIRSGRDDYSPIRDPFFSGAQVLSIREPVLSMGTWIVAEGPDGREHSIGLPHIFIPRLAVLVLDCKARLRRVHTVNITLDVLEHFEPLFAALPALTHVTIYLETLAHAQSAPARNPPPRLPGWTALACVENVLNAAPKLEMLVIDVWSSWNAAGDLPTIGDAQDIVWYLAFLEHHLRVPDIRIRGFTTNFLLNLNLNGLPIHFDSEDSVAPTKYWPFEAEYHQ